MPIVWNLYYPASSQDDINQLRTHYEALRVDPHVTSGEIIDDPHSLFQRILRVTFLEGVSQPSNPAYWYLDLRYPSRVIVNPPPLRIVNQALPPPDLTPEQIESITKAMQSMDLTVPQSNVVWPPPTRGVFDFAQAIGTLPELPRLDVPKWVQTGAWVQRKGLKDQCLLIEGVSISCPRGCVTGLMYGNGKPYKDYYDLQSFTLTFEPADGPPHEACMTSWERLLTFLDEKD